MRLAVEKEAKFREKEAKKQRRRELLGDDYVSEDEEESVEDVEVVGEGVEGAGEGLPPAKEEKVKEPGTILSSFYSHSDEKKFWVSMVSAKR